MRRLILFYFGFMLGSMTIANRLENECSINFLGMSESRSKGHFYSKHPNPRKHGEQPTIHCNFTFLAPTSRAAYFLMLFIEITVPSVKPGIVEFTYPDGTAAEFFPTKDGAVSFKTFLAINDEDVKFGLNKLNLPSVALVDPRKSIKLVQFIKGRQSYVPNDDSCFFDGSHHLRSYWVEAEFKRGSGKYKQPNVYRTSKSPELHGYEFQKGGQKKKGSSSVNLSTIILIVVVAISVIIIGILVFKLRLTPSPNNQQSTNAEQTALRTAEQPVDNAAQPKI